MGDILKLCDELEALLEKATPGFKRATRTGMARLLLIGAEHQRPKARDFLTGETDFEADADFIVSSMEALPTLLQALRQSEKAVKAERERCARIAEDAADSRHRLFEDNGSSINAHRHAEASDIAAAIRSSGQEG